MALRMGAEDKKKVAIAAVLGLIVLGLGGKMLWENFATPDVVADDTCNRDHSTASNDQWRSLRAQGGHRQSRSNAASGMDDGN